MTRFARNQKAYRQRYDAEAISPNVEVSKRAKEALIRRAAADEQLTAEEIKRLRNLSPKENRQWVVHEVVGLLEQLADEWGVD